MGKKSRKLDKVGAGIAAAYLASKMGDSGSATATDTAKKKSVFDYEYDAYKGPSKKSATPFEHEGSVMPKKRSKSMTPGKQTIPYKSMSSMFGFQGGGSVVTKGQGRVMKSKKTILLT